MGTIWVREFTGGLDTRRMPETTKGGALIKAVDGHINRGGEFEQRAAFVEAFTLPTDITKSLVAGKRSLYVFGNAAPSSYPAGIIYQQLLHPLGSSVELVAVLSADLYAGLIYAVALFADGSTHHFYNGTRVTDWVDARARATFSVDGSAGGILTGLAVNSVQIIGGSITWATSNAATANAIVDAVNSFGSTPEYVAVRGVDDAFSILAADTGTTANGLTVSYASTGDLVLTTAATTLLGGAAVAGDTFQSGPFAKTVSSKVYALSGPNMQFSGIDTPTGWDTGNTGAGFIDLSSETSGAEELVAMARYQQYLAIFAGRAVQIWFIDPDPDNYRITQTLSNTGTLSPRSVTQFGDNDIFYCDENGVRSLRARDASNAASTSDIGIPIDSLITAKLQAMTLAERRRIIGLIEPTDGRFWMIFPDEIFVFSYFTGSKISAWTTYLPTTEVDGEQVAFEIDDAAVFQGRIYLRAGDKIYVYGGTGASPEYDSTAPEVWLPYLDGDKPMQLKHLKGLDVACTGTWSTRIAMQPSDITVDDAVGIVIEKTSYNNPILPAQGASTHFGLRFVGAGSGAKKLSSAVLHYELDEEED